MSCTVAKSRIASYADLCMYTTPKQISCVTNIYTKTTTSSVQNHYSTSVVIKQRQDSTCHMTSWVSPSRRTRRVGRSPTDRGPCWTGWWDCCHQWWGWISNQEPEASWPVMCSKERERHTRESMGFSFMDNNCDTRITLLWLISSDR